MSSDSNVEKMHILIEDDEITNLYKEHEVIDEKDLKDIEVINLENKLIVPGFINTHSHTPMAYFRGVADDSPFKEWLFDNMLPREELMNDEMAYYGSVVSLMEMASKGITTCVDMYMFTNSIAKAFYDFGMRGYISRGLAFDTKEGWERRINENIDTYNKFNGKDKRLWIGFGPHAPYTVNNERLCEVANLAKKYNTHVQIHLHEASWEKEEYSLLDIEKTGLFEVPTIAAHCVQVDKHDIEVLSKNNVTVSHNPSSNLKLGNGIAPINKMLDENINICLGTDGVASNNSLDIMKEMYIASLLQKSKNGSSSIKTNEVLRMVWENGGFALNEKIGRLEPGFKADLAVIDLNFPEFYPLDTKRLKSHLLFSANSRNVFATMVGGKWIYYNKNFLNIKEGEVYERFQTHYNILESSFNSTNK